jgi:hypothetical protein
MRAPAPHVADWEALTTMRRRLTAMKGDLEKGEIRAGLPILAFLDARAFDAWLEAQKQTAPGLWLKFAKKGVPQRTLTKAEAIDTALCHGWIDGKTGHVR